MPVATINMIFTNRSEIFSLIDISYIYPLINTLGPEGGKHFSNCVLTFLSKHLFLQREERKR